MAELKASTKTEENDHEMYFRWYLEELKEKGFIKSFSREHETFIVSDKMVYKREKHYKSKPNTIEEFNLFRDTTYTYDFRIIWAERALNVFTEVLTFNGVFKYGKPNFVSHRIELSGKEEIVSYVDVKPHHAAARFGGGKMASYYTFPIIQKWLYMLKGLYVNKIVPIHTGKYGRTTCLFATTFVPNRYVFTDKSGAMRNIPYRKVTADSYIHKKMQMIEELVKNENSKNSQQTLL